MVIFISMNGHGQATECSANAGPDYIMCFDETMVLDAPSSVDYNLNPNIQWTFVSGPVNPLIDTPNSLNSTVTPPGGGLWTPGVYTFQFCVDCRDNNGDQIFDRPCDEVTITVTKAVSGVPAVTGPVDALDGHIKFCTSGTFTMSTLAPGEFYEVLMIPNDGLVTAQISGNQITLTKANVVATSRCDYTVKIILSNGGCSSDTYLDVSFANPYYRNGDGIVKGHVYNCPSCSRHLQLVGDRPGCGGTGKWEVISTPNGVDVNDVDFQNENTNIGYVDITVPQNGSYTFAYVVNNDPCPESRFEITCNVLELAEFSLGSGKVYKFCGNVVPAGVYSHTLNEIPNAIYTVVTSTNTLGVTATISSSGQLDISFETDVTLPPEIVVTATAIRYFFDADCGGPEPAVLIELPYNTNEENLAYIDSLGNCVYQCATFVNFVFTGAPIIKVQAPTVYFLCSGGSEVIQLQNYFTVINGANSFLNITDENDDPVLPYQFLNLGFGDHSFTIEAIGYNYDVNPAVFCTTQVVLTFIIRGPENVSAGTDQIKCFNEVIFLNGNDPYDGIATGTWSLISSIPTGLSASFSPHDPNTQVFLTGVNQSDLPVTLKFRWSFNNAQSGCDLSDDVCITIHDCIVPCPASIYVTSICDGDKIILTAYNAGGSILDPGVYDINWTATNGTPTTSTGNPFTVTIPPGASVEYTVTSVLVFNDEVICTLRATGTAQCQPLVCGITIRESCDACGNVVLTIVDEDGNTVPPTMFVNEIFWYVYGSGPDDNSAILHQQVNPIVVNPNACYKLKYNRFYYSGQPIPGTWYDICKYESPKTCVSISCPGPCSNFPEFFVAGCGDLTDLALNLPFSSVCDDVCDGFGTLGVFYYNALGQIVAANPADFNILWKDGSTGTYATGQMFNINRVKVTPKGGGCCFWQDAYSPNCPCTVVPSVNCEQPITKYCYEDGTVEYITGIPRIVWTAVSGATSYEVEINFDMASECCNNTANSGLITLIVDGQTYYEIPSSMTCFAVRVRALSSECEATEWSAWFFYCPEQYCEVVITTCGCCRGERSAAAEGVKINVLPEEDILAIFAISDAPRYSTLEAAMRAIKPDSHQHQAFGIYPNPTANRLTIAPHVKQDGLLTVRVFDLTQRAWINTYFEGNTTGVIDVNELSNGVYMLSISNEKGEMLHSQKVVVLK